MGGRRGGEGGEKRGGIEGYDGWGMNNSRNIISEWDGKRD